MNNSKNILVLGASGMLGNAVLRVFNDSEGYNVRGAVRHNSSISLFSEDIRNLVSSGLNIDDDESLRNIIVETESEIVINCIGLVKQLSNSENPLVALPINSLFPHRLAKICDDNNSRLIHMSTDCVFSGSKGFYNENDIPDSFDLYGVSKRLGEVDYPNTITLRTSIIGHELNTNRSLIDWFLSQKGSIEGYTRAIFSGLPTNELAKIIRDYVIPNINLTGIYHVSAEPISKYELLSLVAKIYGKSIKIKKNNDFEIDRSLDSTRFRDLSGFNPLTWRELVASMYNFNNKKRM
jgi:dTDP-4-dehydrorhamnose reductase